MSGQGNLPQILASPRDGGVLAHSLPKSFGATPVGKSEKRLGIGVSLYPRHSRPTDREQQTSPGIVRYDPNIQGKGVILGLQPSPS